MSFDRETALKKGGPYPDETVFLVDLHEFTISDGSYVGRSSEGRPPCMLKDNKKYDRRRLGVAGLGRGRPGPKPIVTDATNNASNVTRARKDPTTFTRTYIP